MIISGNIQKERWSNDFELEAATIPLAAMTAAFGLYQRLSLPLPWHPATKSIPLIIYGAATAVGSFAIQLAQQSNIHPLICVAGRGATHVESLINKEKGDEILDYRIGNAELVQSMQAAVKKAGGKVEHAFDTISEPNTFQNICEVLDHNTGQITLVLLGKDYSAIPSGISKSTTYVGAAHAAMDPEPWQKKTGTKVGNEEFAHALFRFFGRGLQKGFFKGHPYQVIPGGLAGIEKALTDLKGGKASAVKYVFRIEETEGVAGS